MPTQLLSTDAAAMVPLNAVREAACTSSWIIVVGRPDVVLLEAVLANPSAVLVALPDDRAIQELEEAHNGTWPGHVELAAALIGAEAGEVAWFHYNDPRHNGLVGPEALLAAYPNLRLLSVELRPQRSLQDLLAGWEPAQGAGQGLLVLCDDAALSWLPGAGPSLRCVERLVWWPSNADGEATTAVEGLDTALQEQWLVATAPGIWQHDRSLAFRATVQAERDALLHEREQWRIRIEQCEGRIQELQGLLSAQSSQTLEQSQQRDALQKRVEELQGQLSAQSAQMLEQSQQREALTKERDALRSERDGFATKQEELTAQRDSLTKERDALRSERDSLYASYGVGEGLSRIGTSEDAPSAQGLVRLDGHGQFAESWRIPILPEVAQNHTKGLVLKTKYDVINLLIKSYNLASYLEVNKFDGTLWPAAVSAKHVEILRLNDLVRYSKGASLKEHISPAGEAIKQVESIFQVKEACLLPSYDVIFYDPFHRRPEVDEGLLELLLLLKPRGFLVVHDVYPKSPLLCTTQSEAGKEWCGTTYKAFALFKMNNQESTISVDCDYGVGIIRNQDNLNTHYAVGWNIDYADLCGDNAGQNLNLIDPGEFVCMMDKGIDPFRSQR